MSKDLSTQWLDDDVIEEEEETVYGGGSESPFIQGYGLYDTKITMAKRILTDKEGSDTEWIEIDFVNKEGKTHTERFMVKGKNGKPSYTKDGVVHPHKGLSKIKSLIGVLGLYTGAKNVMKELYSHTEEADVTWTAYGKEKTAEFTIFNDLINKKVKLCLTSKKENSTTSATQDDADEQKYINQCVKDTKKYVIANPKKKSLKKFVDSPQSKNYPNVYRWFTVSEVKHFVSMDGLMNGETESKKLKVFMDANDEGVVFEARTLIPETMDERTLAKIGINQWGKRVDPVDNDGYTEPVEAEEAAEVEDDDNW